jgi:hypothetical protein
VELASPSEVRDVGLVAPSWLPALPPRRFETASGCSSTNLTPVTEVPEDPLLEFASLSEPDRVSAARASGVAASACAAVTPGEPGFRLSWGSCSLERNDAGCPVSPHHGLAAAAGKVRVAKPPPVPSSGFLPLSTVLAALAARTRPLRIPPFAVAPRRFAVLFHTARAPGVALQSFPLSRSRTRSRGPRASLRVRVRPPNGAAGPRVSRPLSPLRRPLATAGPKARRTVRPGRRFPGVARRRTSRVAAFVYGVSSRISRARRIRQPARPLRSFALLGSPFTRQRSPWPGHGRRAGALLSLSL